MPYFQGKKVDCRKSEPPNILQDQLKMASPFKMGNRAPPCRGNSLGMFLFHSQAHFSLVWIKVLSETL